MINLATSMMQQGHYTDAEKLDLETLEMRRRILGPEHPDTALSVYNLAIVEERLGKRAAALNLLHDAIHHGLTITNALGIEKDPDLKSLHSDPGFALLVADAREAAATQKPH